METLWTFISNHKHRLFQVDQFFLGFWEWPRCGGIRLDGKRISAFICMDMYICIYIYTDSDNCASSELQSIAHTSHHFQTFEISKTMSISSFIKYIIFGFSDQWWLTFWHVLTNVLTNESMAVPSQVAIYCHSLDVGLAKVHHLIEAQDVNGLAVRVSSTWTAQKWMGFKSF